MSEEVSNDHAVMTRCSRYSGRVVIVTGGAQGLGRVTAKRIAEEGGDVVVADLQEERAAATAASLATETGRTVVAVTGDLATAEGAEHLRATTVDRFGRIDTFIACAAYQARLPFLEFPEDKLQRSVEANVWALVRPLQAVLPVMMEQRYGRVVTIGGVAFEHGMPWHSFLAGVGKGSVVGLTTTLAAEFGSFGITVNCVSPGGMETRNDGTTDSKAGGREAELNPTAEQVARYLGTTTVGGRDILNRGRAHPTEVAAAIAFLGSDEASYITGQLLRVSGGLSML